MQAVQALQVKVAAAYKALHGPHIAAASKVTFHHSPLLTFLMLLFSKCPALPCLPCLVLPLCLPVDVEAAGLRDECSLELSEELQLQEQGSLASSGIASPAKSESSDEMGFSHSPDSQVMQQQMDWLLLKLITSSQATSPDSLFTADTEPAMQAAIADANGNNMHSPSKAQRVKNFSSQADYEAIGDNLAEELSMSPEAELEGTKAASHNNQAVAEQQHTVEQLQSHPHSAHEANTQAESLRRELKSVQARLEASQAATAEAAGLRQELLQLHSRLTASEQQAAQSQHLTQQVSQLQSDLQTAQELAAALQVQVDIAKPGGSSQGPAGHSRASSRSDMELSVSQAGLQQELMEQASMSMSITEADLVEAASNAIQAQARFTITPCMLASCCLRSGKIRPTCN